METLDREVEVTAVEGPVALDYAVEKLAQDR